MQKSKTDKALKAFYGARDVSRPQEIFTPVELLQPMYDVWGEIALDPCSHPDAPIDACYRWYGTASKWDDKGVPVAWTGRGLLHDWSDCTYVNPPFSELRAWIDKARSETEQGRIVLLCPARLQRPWLRALIRDERWSTVALNSVKFHGYDQAFPQALLILTTDRRLAIEYEARGLGEVL